MPFLDEAKEIDGEPSILPGSPVQKQIDEALEKANLVLLIDTPSAPASPWIKHEVDTADALLLPILPLCFRDKDDRKVGPRFPSLLALQRWVPIQRPDATDNPPLSIKQLDQIVIRGGDIPVRDVSEKMQSAVHCGEGVRVSWLCMEGA